MCEDISAAVRAAEQQRCAAMIVNDVARLEELLDPRLQFHHATGSVDDKAAYLAKIEGGRIEYVAIRWNEDVVTPLDAAAALMTGRMTTDVRVEGIEKHLENRVMTAWALEYGAWRMVGFQSTPITG